MAANPRPTIRLPVVVYTSWYIFPGSNPEGM